MTTKNHINQFQWEKFYSKDVLLEAAKQTQIKQKSGWLLPQLLADWAQLPLETEGGVINCKQTLLKHLENDLTRQAQHRVLVYLNRGDILDKQTTEQNRNYSTLVPLIMSAHKKYNGVSYESWRGAKYLELVVPKLLLEAMQSGELYGECCGLGPDQLLQIRDEGLMVKSGAAEGQMRSPLTTWQLVGVTHPLVKQLPKLAQTMLTQIWCAHPQQRTEYMILDPQNWDLMPTPLISTELFMGQEPTTEPKYPWDM